MYYRVYLSVVQFKNSSKLNRNCMMIPAQFQTSKYTIQHRFYRLIAFPIMHLNLSLVFILCGILLMFIFFFLKYRTKKLIHFGFLIGNTYTKLFKWILICQNTFSPISGSFCLFGALSCTDCDCIETFDV